MLELSAQYDLQAQILRERITELQLRWAKCKNETLRSTLAERIRTLTVMRREAQELAVLCARYYERGYRRNERYTI